MFEQRQSRQRAEGARKVRETDYGGRLLSDEVRDFLGDLAEDGLARSTQAEAKYSCLKLFRFLGCDPPLRDLTAETPRDFLAWLRATPSRRNKQGTVPREVTRESIRGFLARLKEAQEITEATEISAFSVASCLISLRPTEQTVGKDWRTVAPLFRRIGLSTELRRRERISQDLLPVRLPCCDEVAGWWAASIAAAPTWRTRRDATRVARTQALLLLTGMRVGECLAARTADLEGRWLLLRKTKTGRPRIVYISRLALALAAELRREPQRQGLLFAELAAATPREARFAGWPASRGAFSRLAAARLGAIPISREIALPEKPQQTMRQLCSTYMLEPCRRDVEAECLQLGHGGGLQQKHYVDAMQRLPGLLEPWAERLSAFSFQLSALPDEPLVWPDARRGGIWDELRRLLQQGRRAEGGGQ